MNYSFIPISLKLHEDLIQIAKVVDDIIFIVWGPSEKLLAEDKELQNYLKKMMETGIVVEACKACSDMYGVSDQLEKLGVDVKFMGVPLTDYLKGDMKTITF